jgi:hypothetical protein
MGSYFSVNFRDFRTRKKREDNLKMIKEQVSIECTGTQVNTGSGFLYGLIIQQLAV